jgi:flagellar biosynthesis protein FlhF
MAPSALIVTKWDETQAPGEVVSFAAEEGLPLLFVTDGQDVPDAIHSANAMTLARSLVEGAPL